MKASLSHLVLTGVLTGVLLGYGATKVPHSQQAQMYPGVLGTNGSCGMHAAPGDTQALWQFVDCINATRQLSDICMSLGGSFSDGYDSYADAGMSLTYEWECIDVAAAPVPDPAYMDPTMDPAMDPAYPAAPVPAPMPPSPSSSSSSVATGTGGDGPPSEFAPPSDNYCAQYAMAPDLYPGGLEQCELCNEAGGSFDGWSCQCPAPYTWSPDGMRCVGQCPVNSMHEPNGTCACMPGTEWNADMNMCAMPCPENGTPDPSGIMCTCDAGYEWNGTLTACVEPCPAGAMRDPATDECSCMPGTVINDTGTECTPSIEVTALPSSTTLDSNGEPYEDSGTVVSNNSINCVDSANPGEYLGTCDEQVAMGNTVTLTATPTADFTLKYWLSPAWSAAACPCDSSTDLTCEFVATSEVACAAVMMRTDVVNVTVDAQASHISVTHGDTPEECGDESTSLCTYAVEKDANVTLSPFIPNGQEFWYWSGLAGVECPCDKYSQECSFVASQESYCYMELQAEVTPPPQDPIAPPADPPPAPETVDLQVYNFDGATINVTAGAMNAVCNENSCTYDVEKNSQIILDPMIPDGKTFGYWSGLAGGTCPCPADQPACFLAAAEDYTCSLGLFDNQ